jgi:hypothetical protein
MNHEQINYIYMVYLTMIILIGLKLIIVQLPMRKLIKI